jgi:hypothetical protein
MLNPLPTEDADLSNKRELRANYIREYNRARGARPLKGTTFNCERCGKSSARVSLWQKWCAECKPSAMKERDKAKRAADGAVVVGTELVCKNCEARFRKKGKRQFYCNPCSLLNKAEALPHQIENRNRRAATFQRERRRNDPKWGIASRMSAGIANSLKDGKNGRSWEGLVGYNVTDLMVHLEKQFLVGMSWKNRAIWHIDHIIPLSSFSFNSNSDPEFVAAWAMTNLRPLWSAENILKSNKRTHLI